MVKRKLLLTFRVNRAEMTVLKRWARGERKNLTSLFRERMLAPATLAELQRAQLTLPMKGDDPPDR